MTVFILEYVLKIRYFLNRKQKFIWAIPSQESEEGYKDRFFSIKICYVLMFMSAVSFTITISSMWPYLQIVGFEKEKISMKICILKCIFIPLKIDKTTNTSYFGWIVSAFSIGKLLKFHSNI